MTGYFKATVEQAALTKVLDRIHRVVERRNTIPILGNILVEVGQDDIRFRATDLDISLQDSVRAEVSAKGSITIPGHLFHDVVKKLPQGSQVVLEQEEHVVVVKAGRSRFKLPTLPVGDFPDLPFGDLTHSFAMTGKDLHGIFDRARFAISSEETRYYLNGVYFHTAVTHNVQMIRGVATDGHRLAQVETKIPDGAAGMSGIIIPTKAVTEMLRLFAADDEIQIEVNQSKLQASTRTMTLLTKLIDGTFPDYGRVIPQNNDKIMKVARKDLAAATDRVATVSSERGRAVKMSLSTGKLVLAVSNPDSGSATEEMDVDYESDALDVGFNSRYLADILAEIVGDIVVMKFADPGSPTIVSSEADDSALYVLMPMRV